MKRTTISAKSAAALFLMARCCGAAILYEDVKLSPTDGQIGDRFGTRVAISGGFALIGASQASTPTSDGAAYLFDASTGEQLYKLQPDLPDGIRATWFGGYDVSFDPNGDAVVHSQSKTGSEGLSESDEELLRDGKTLYVFDPLSGLQRDRRRPEFGRGEPWSRQAAFTDDWLVFDTLVYRVLDLLTGEADYLGRVGAPGLEDDYLNSLNIAISGDYAALGAPGNGRDGDGIGRAYVFYLPTLELVAELRPSDPVPYNRFGYAVDIDGNQVVVGTREPASFNETQIGGAYVFTFVPEPTTAALAVILAATLTVGRRR